MKFTELQINEFQGLIEKKWTAYYVKEEICSGGPAVVFLIRRRDEKTRWDRYVICIDCKDDTRFANMIDAEIESPGKYFKTLDDPVIYDYDSCEIRHSKVYLIQTGIINDIKKWTDEKAREEQNANNRQPLTAESIERLKHLRSLCRIDPDEIKEISDRLMIHSAACENLKKNDVFLIIEGLLDLNQLSEHNPDKDLIDKALLQLKSKYQELQERPVKEEDRSKNLKISGTDLKTGSNSSGISGIAPNTSSAVSLKKLVPGQKVLFGRYPQSFDGRKIEPIGWQVLEVQADKALLLSEKALDAKKFNEFWSDVTWPDCTLLRWLNGEFMNKAFNAEEQKRILTTDNVTNGESHTSDRIFLLSLEEAEKYFAENEDRQCVSTDYARAKGARKNHSGFSWWWLRTSAHNINNSVGSVCAIGGDGSCDTYGNAVDSSNGAVRPACWISI